ncbi:GGDEF domain-containing protein [Geodermatophilus maliterrae]|uniref:GGDEF domain-containing protein n=1 Tax=Geodermatophilus maliterrae TaxID=3162531 RepID=A0ABV3XKH2_9ACTN
MDLPAILRPRDEVFAARALAAMFLGSALLLVTYVLVQPTPLPEGGVAVAVGLLTGLVACGVALVTVRRQVLTRLCVWVVLPVAGLGVISTVAALMPERLDLAHPLFGLVILYTASQLRAPVAAVVTALTIGCDVTVLALIEPPAEALVDAVFIGTVLAATAGLIILFRNRVERLMGALERQAAVDTLTGLVTRRVLDDALSSALSASSTPEGTALVLVDVDSFKSVNDSYGHPVGDDALVHLAGLLRQHVRSGDAVLGRLGGDELAVLLPGCSLATAAERAEHLVTAVRATPLQLTDGTLLALSVSVGVAHAPQHATELRTLYAAADGALYEAKRAGRGRAVLAS